MKLMSLKQYMKMSKPALIRKITKALRAMPKAKLARLCYNITKSKLPRLRKTKRKSLPKQYPRGFPLMKPTLKDALSEYNALEPPYPRGFPLTETPYSRREKRKFSRKQLAAQRLFAKRARAGTLKRRRR